MEPIVQITSYRPFGVIPHRSPDRPAHRAARAADNSLLLVLWVLLSLACCAAAMAVVDVL
ncbi:hypothetical protein CTP10_R50220 [Cupriavidus sp. P-10]|uniref:hypothetical protein n=1 Tax=Cupriavidus sp. P-10 TaxID=2027911 RepID=UPI000E2F8C43|nr:hypothetical protein [Cupriavidus sp. P-10]BDB27614.1 hypothetical protein CTP10_R50220 [Cupriavidus sp. P-10]